MEKVNLASGEGQILEMAGRAKLIGLNSFFSVKKVYEES